MSPNCFGLELIRENSSPTAFPISPLLFFLEDLAFSGGDSKTSDSKLLSKLLSGVLCTDLGVAGVGSILGGGLKDTVAGCWGGSASPVFPN